MAKGKGQSRKRPAVEKKFDGGGSRMKAVNTWDDMEHDSEDEFHDARGTVLLDHEMDMANRNNDDSEGSEEEVFGLDDGEDDEEEESEDDLGDLDDDFGGAKEDSEEDIDKASWGKSKRSYYNADEIESDEETAKAEEEEALRLQKKRIAEMSEEDFAPEEEETAWGAAAGRGTLGDKDADRALVEGFDRELQGIDLLKAQSGGVVVEKIAKAGISKLSKQEILKVLQNQSPELLELVEEFKEKTEQLQAVAEVLEMVSAMPKPLPETMAPMPFLRLKYQTLINYLTNIAFYITLKTSPDTSANDLRDHPVIDAMLELKTSIGKLEKLEEKKNIRESMEDLLDILENGAESDEDEEDEEEIDEEEMQRLLEEEAKAKKAAKAKKSKKEGAEKKKTDSKKEFEYNVELEDEFVSHKKAKKNGKSISDKKRARLESDYGDLDELLDVDLEDKVQKKKSLRDYVAKLDQSANKRSKILRGSGDTDIPYRERFKDRQEQMKRQAVKSAPAPENADLDDLEWSAKDKADARGVDDDVFSGDEGRGGRGGDSDGEDFYQEVVRSKEAKKAARKALNENLEHSTSFEDTSLDPNDKRSISWQILKNKGLTPHRKKEQRNPRVKHRNKYEQAKKKIKSVKRVFTRLEGSYGGEKTGIKTGLARSVKFN
ncbi:U3 small nucleolar RNA-associated protein 3 [Entomortierella parvispora]|uniref:U3 small nucleolar RNA-associated protein 3 n=1 Tax=Entomortierella parvispora TaxID=205924 RepID=A0A9P3LVS0_9FUNG|nr:U3 small nucleolar RNA-associated protein 3 [Entomortierella parvispora]